MASGTSLLGGRGQRNRVRRRDEADFRGRIGMRQIERDASSPVGKPEWLREFPGRGKRHSMRSMKSGFCLNDVIQCQPGQC